MDTEEDQHDGGRESICSDTGGDLPGVDTDLFPQLTFTEKTEKLEVLDNLDINLRLRTRKQTFKNKRAIKSGFSRPSLKIKDEKTQGKI